MKNYMYLVIFVLFFIGLFTIFAVSSCAADTITVGPGGPPTYDYATINEAVSSANEGDTINVNAGTYTEYLVIDKQLSLIGVSGSSDTTIITSSSNQNTIEVTQNNVIITGFTVKNLAGSFACIRLNSVTGCQIYNILIQNGGNGLYIINSNNNIIRESTMENNNVAGIYLSNSDGNTIYSNNIQNNNANGVFVSSGCSGNTFYLNDFTDNSDGNARDLGSNNWDYNSQGNYWDDYNNYDSNQDGIGDFPYTITGSNIDNYPLGDFLSPNQNPVAYIDSISPNPAAQGATIYFNGHGSDDGSIYNWEWYINDQRYSQNQEDFSTSSLSPGVYTVKYRVQDDDGLWSDYVTRTLVINANQKPTAYITSPTTSSTYYYGNEISFSGYGVDPENQITGYSWRSVPEGISSTQNSFTKSNLPVGDYLIFFKVKDDYDQWSDEKSITISVLPISEDNQAPVANAGGPYSGKINISIQFNGSKSYDPDLNDIITYQWDFGDETTGIEVSPIHIYNSSGRFFVNLTVVDSFGEKSVSSTYVDITVQQDGQKGNGKNDKIPGFEMILVILAITCLIVINKKIKKKN